MWHAGGVLVAEVYGQAGGGVCVHEAGSVCNSGDPVIWCLAVWEAHGRFM